MKRSELAVVPFHGSDELQELRVENERLREELASLKNTVLHPFVPQIGKSCRMCGQGYNKKVKREGDEEVVELWGPDMKFEQAKPRRWWRAGTPARMRRDCKACGAVYYEMPKRVVE